MLAVDAADAGEAHLGIAAARKLGIPVCSIHIRHEEASILQLEVALLGTRGQSEEPARSRTIPSDEAPLFVTPTADSIALILRTPGTTGKPKAVPLSHANLCYGAQNVAQSYSLGHSDRSYLIQVLFHIHGTVAGLLAPLVSGGSFVVPGKFDADVAWFVESGCAWLSGTPSALQTLLHAPHAGPDVGIKLIRSYSAPLLPSTFKELQKFFGCPVLEAYAMTENTHQMTTNIAGQAKPGYVGKPSGSVSLCIFGDDADAGPLAMDIQGEICMTGPSVTGGYLDNLEANAKAFFIDSSGTCWFRMGDIGVLVRQSCRGPCAHSGETV